MPSSPRAFVRLAALALAAVACTADRINAPGASEVTAPLASVTAAAVPQLVITEIMADPSKVADDRGEWFEVYNAGTAAVNLLGWKIASNNDATVHVVSGCLAILPGHYAVFARNADQSVNGGVAARYSYAAGGATINLANNSTDWLELRDPSDVVIDRVNWGATPPGGASRALNNPSLDNTAMNGANWSTTPTSRTYGLGDRGTPGAPNDGSPALPLPPAGEASCVSIAPRPATVSAGATLQLTATAVDVAGNVVPTTFTWSSADAATATVDGAGLLTGIAEGTTSIGATAANGVAGSVSVRVRTPVAARVEIDINFPDTLPVGYTKPAFATVREADGTIITPTPPLTWTSGNPDAFTIDSRGYIGALAVGQGSVSATTPNGITGSWFAPFVIIPADAPTSAVYRDHLAFGTPGGGNVLRKKQYALSYNPERGGPNWVSWNLNATQFGGARRCDCFSADQTIPSGAYRVVDFDYRNGGFDRGHMVQSESRTTTNQENASTFLLTNILPQAADNNQGPWSKFENYLNDLARTGGKEIYVVAGGAYAANPATLKNEGKVAIPNATWKVAVIMPAGEGRADVHAAADIELLAIMIPNESTPGVAITGIRNIPWGDYRATVDSIEQETGYDLLANLPDHIETALEKGDRAPAAVFSAPPSGVEGDRLAFDASQSSDPDPGDVLTYEWSFGDGATATGMTPTHSYADNGRYTVTLRVIDRDGADAIATKEVSVANAPPSITSFDLTSLARARTPAAVSVGYTDPGSADTHQLIVSWGDGATSRVAGDAGLAAARHEYQDAGFYTVEVTLADDDGASVSRTATQYVVVYDAAAGFVTGGGWVEPEGRGMKGNRKATFTTSVRYAAGPTPEGHVNVQLHGRGVSFESDALEWMVVQGTRAWIRGTGTIEGESGSYSVLVTVTDDGKDDRVRVRIWSPAGTVVYDNQPDAPTIEPASAVLGGGNVTVHAKP